MIAYCFETKFYLMVRHYIEFQHSLVLEDIWGSWTLSLMTRFFGLYNGLAFERSEMRHCYFHGLSWKGHAVIRKTGCLTWFCQMSCIVYYIFINNLQMIIILKLLSRRWNLQLVLFENVYYKTVYVHSNEGTNWE